MVGTVTVPIVQIKKLRLGYVIEKLGHVKNVNNLTSKNRTFPFIKNTKILLCYDLLSSIYLLFHQSSVHTMKSENILNNLSRVV